MNESDLDAFKDEVLAESVSGPGQRLRAARERAGLTLVEVAERLHLDEEVVEAIEENDESRLPGPVFTQGYLRNYARLVGEPVEEVLSGFASTRPAGESRPTLRQYKTNFKAQRVSSSHALMRAITWLFIIGLIALLVVWWRGYLPIPDPTQLLGMPTDEPAAGGVAPAPASGAIVLERPAPGDEQPAPAQPAAPMALPVLDEAVPAAAPVPAGRGDDSEESRIPAGSGEDGPATDAPSDPAPPEEDEGGDAVPAEPVTGESEPSLPPDREGVVFEFESPCWVDVRDSRGRKVLYGGIGGGESHRLDGDPPYRVVLGNSSAVGIRVNGRLIDTPFPADGGRVARFSIHPEKDPVIAAGLGR